MGEKVLPVFRKSCSCFSSALFSYKRQNVFQKYQKRNMCILVKKRSKPKIFLAYHLNSLCLASFYSFLTELHFKLHLTAAKLKALTKFCLVKVRLSPLLHVLYIIYSSYIGHIPYIINIKIFSDVRFDQNFQSLS